ncbi:MAG TPA: hypothetical protein VMV32_05815 [Ignavibacteriaceae bacterium]|nr:hypothetical protein [Ignavibacteriaceae bacterium]
MLFNSLMVTYHDMKENRIVQSPKGMKRELHLLGEKMLSNVDFRV